MDRRIAALAFFALLVAAAGVSAAGPADSRDLAGLIDQLQSGDAATAEGAYERMLEEAPHLREAMQARLLGFACASPLDIRRALIAAWRRVEPKNGERFDLTATLLRMRAAGDTNPGLAPAIEAAALIQTLAATHDSLAFRPLVAFALQCDGAFKPDIQREFRSAGGAGLAGLILERSNPRPEVRELVRTWTEEMGYDDPSRMVQEKSRPALAQILTAFAEVSDFEAMPLVLSFANDESTVVRRAAREAIRRFGRNIIWQLRDAYRASMGQDPEPGWSADDIASRLFAASDEVRLARARTDLAGAESAARAGNYPEMRRLVAEALSREPDLQDRDRVAGWFRDWGQRLIDGSRFGEARDALLAAAALDPASLAAGALFDLAEARELEAAGLPAAPAYRRVLAEDPENRLAAARLRALEDPRGPLGTRLLRAGGILVVAALAYGLLRIHFRSGGTRVS